MLRCRGIRGATTATTNTGEAILEATRELLSRLIERNEVDLDDIASAFFTVTDDLDATHPALAARQLGWHDVALLCAREIPVPASLPRCIRVLLHVNTERGLADIRHVYLREAVTLRPSRADQPSPATPATSTASSAPITSSTLAACHQSNSPTVLPEQGASR